MTGLSIVEILRASSEVVGSHIGTYTFNIYQLAVWFLVLGNYLYLIVSTLPQIRVYESPLQTVSSTSPIHHVP